MIKLPTLLLAGFAAACAAFASEPYVPTHEENPWPDDYSDVAFPDSMRAWGTYNVHDPAGRKVGDFYYMYSTDAIYFQRRQRPQERRERPKMGFLQMRRSADLVNWEFLGWAFDSIPQEGAKWVADNNNGRGPGNIWAPYMIPAPDGKTFRLYYCLSAFGRKTSAISLAEAPSPEGPWTHKGIVVRTNNDTPMNAIDPSVAVDPEGRQWMHYGSYFEGLYCVELDPATGLAKAEGDLGHLVARRANYRRGNLEGPEIINVPEQGRYYYFGSYDDLANTYNVRAARGNAAEGPFIDFFGKEIADTTNNFPILTAPYQFEGHIGWGGTGHCGVMADGAGRYFMAHQGRLAPGYGMMDLHLREIFFTPDGWPVVSPERYAGTPARKFSDEDLAGQWEIIRIQEPNDQREVKAEWKEGDPLRGSLNKSTLITFKPQGATDGQWEWKFDADSQLLSLKSPSEEISGIIVHHGHDWELQQRTILATGLDARGRSVWLKRVK
ncbi:MAG: arabinan endo-1,5-alpha-L-arabinosidase [Clostridium sp.]|nr:arabinan endo-1,5-alpha-L-arabinosidase [Clostridium sp.]